jgi:hypothetical protein
VPAKLRFFDTNSTTLNLNGGNETKAPASTAQILALSDERPTAVDSSPAEVLLETPVPSSQPEVRTDRPSFGLHEILKNTDYGFNLDLSLLEKYAGNSAILHAQAGLPHQDVAAEDELEAEKVLRVRAAELFLDWSSKVRRKVQDAIQVSTLRVGDGIVQLRHALDQLELTMLNMKDGQLRLRQFENRSAGVQKTVEYGSLLQGKAYWAMFAVLALVDWVANVPIFMQLLPRDPYAEGRFQDFVEGAEQYGIWDGFVILLHRQMSSPEVSLLALGIVVILMFLCHGCGKSLRKLIAYRSKDEPMIELGIRSHRRQAWLAFSFCLAGLVFALSFLFISRGKIEQVTQTQARDAAAQVEQLKIRLKSATDIGDPDATTQASADLDAAQKKQKERENTHNYAAGISSMNYALGILNVVLVLAAVTASYLHDKGNITEVAFGDPKMLALEAELKILREDAVAHRARIRTLDAEVQANILQARFLSQCSPLRDWRAKAARLGAVVPLFRTENARHRGTDVQLIKGFREERAPDIAEPIQEPFHLPDELLRWETEFAEFRSAIERLNAQNSAVLTEGV